MIVKKRYLIFYFGFNKVFIILGFVKIYGILNKVCMFVYLRVYRFFF